MPLPTRSTMINATLSTDDQAMGRLTLDNMSVQSIYDRNIANQLYN